MLKNRILLRHLSKNKYYSNKRFNHESSASAYTQVPEYPPIVDVSYKGKKERVQKEWAKKIQSLPTVEQKIMELNMPKYYGYWAAQVKDTDVPLAGGDFIRYATRTHVIDKLPESYYDDVRPVAEVLLMNAKDVVEAVADVQFHSSINTRTKWSKNPANHINKQSASFIYTLNHSLCTLLGPVAAHLQEARVDQDPRVEAFWFLGGFEWSEFEKKRFKSVTEALDYSTKPIQGYTMPSLRLRTADGLPEVQSLSDSEAYTLSIPRSKVDPRNAYYTPEHKHANINPGFWPGAEKEHSHLFFHTRHIVPMMVKKYGDGYPVDEMIRRYFISVGFTQAHAQSMWLGFGPLSDMTYPIVQQSVMTDGHHMSLGVYQLNTSKLDAEAGYNNPRTNVLWLSPEEKLYDTVEDGKIKGLNYQLLLKLMCMYLKSPQPREDATPYLAEYKYLAGHTSASEEYRNNFFKYLLYLSGDRRTSLEKPTVEWWEYIYKIKFQHRPMDSRFKWFEVGGIPLKPRMMEPRKRRLDEHAPARIRKKFWTEERGRREQYFPRIHSEKLFKYDRKVLKYARWKDHPDWLD